MIRTIKLDDKTIEYTLCKKRVKNFNLRVKPSGEIYVSCPYRVTIKEIESFIESNKDFVFKSLKKMETVREKRGEDILYVDGDIVKVFGKPKTLCVLPGRRNVAYLNNNQINLLVTDTKDLEQKKKAVKRLLDRLCKEEILKQCEEIYRYFKEYTKEYPKISMKNMTSQWGSCNSTKNKLSFNLSLINYEKGCLRYVVIHEFSHFVYQDHSDNFYSVIEKIMPEYKVYQKILKNVIL